MIKKLLTSTIIAASLFAAPVFADWEPEGSVTMFTMFPPGGGGDVLSRAVAKHFEDTLGWNVVVQNKPGGGGAAMAKILKDSPADGMTIGFAVSETFLFQPVMNPEIGYSIEDFQLLGSIANTQIGWVAKADSPYNSLEDMVEAAKGGEEIAVGVFSPRANAAVRAIGKHFDVEFTPVPVKSGAEGVTNVLTGHLATTMAAGPQAPHVLSGDLKVLSSLEAERLIAGGDALTVAESGVDIATFRVKWLLAAPKDLPEEVSQAWNAAVESTLDNEELLSFIENKMSLRMVYTDGEAVKAEIMGGVESTQELIGYLTE